MQNEIMVIPRGNPGLEPISLDMSYLREVEGRIVEVATVTAIKAPELLAYFNQAWLDVSRFIAMITLELNRAKTYSKSVRSRVILERAPARLRELGLSSEKNPGGSADLREAVLDGDPEYIEALDRQDQIEAMLSILEGKEHSFEMAYNSVKKILGETSSFEHRRHPGLSAGSEIQGEVGSESDTRFGRARY